MYAKGEKVVFYPPQNEGDNLHWPAVVEDFTKCRIKVRVYDKPDGTLKTVTAKRLARQDELPL
jgi:hypothetical protein